MKLKDLFCEVDEAIEELKKGNFIIVTDNEDRENEGDLIIAAEMITRDKINFMETHARGLICTPMSKQRCKELSLHLMVPDSENNSNHTTPFTVSVDLLGNNCTTGISAHDRAETILALSRIDTRPFDLARPGHIFPLMAHDNGVLGREGHTEAVVDLVRLAGFRPIGVLIEIKKKDGEMARLPELVLFAKAYNFKIVSISKLIAYRKLNSNQNHLKL